MDIDTGATKGEQLIRFLAPLVSGTKGSDALNRFAKLVVIGAASEKGFEDARNNDKEEVFKNPYLSLGHFNVLVRFSFLNEHRSFVWDFASGTSVGQALGESYASSKGRHSQWVGEGAEKRWEEKSIAGVVLVGLDSKDEFRFYYVTRSEFHLLDKDRIIKRPEEALDWEKAWKDLTFQPTFSSIM